jgi:hypothetical protein
MHPLDRFVKNTYEMLSPLNEITSTMRLTSHQFLTADRKVQKTVFGQGDKAVEVVVNAGPTEYVHGGGKAGEVVLPPYGFVIHSPSFAAFHALSWAGRRYAAPALFTLRSLDGLPLDRSRKVRVFHGFGDSSVQVGKASHTVEKEAVVSARP